MRRPLLVVWQRSSASMPSSTEQPMISASAAIDLHSKSISSWPGGSLLHINTPKTAMGSHSKHKQLTFAQPRRRTGKTQTFQLLGNTREEFAFSSHFCSSSLSFSPLNRRPFPRVSEGCLAHLIQSRGSSRRTRSEGGHGTLRQPAGASLMAAFYSESHKLAGHYSYWGVSDKTTRTPFSEGVRYFCACGTTTVQSLNIQTQLHN